MARVGPGMEDMKKHGFLVLYIMLLLAVISVVGAVALWELYDLGFGSTTDSARNATQEWVNSTAAAV